MSLRRRLDGHLTDARRGKRSRVYCWVVSLLRQNLRPKIVGVEVVDSYESLNEAEQHWIAYFRYLGARLTNMTRGGDNHLAGIKLSEEHKRKISEGGKRRQGWKISAEGAENIRRSRDKLRGVKRPPLSAEHRAKISAGNKGKQRSPEQRARMSESARNRKKRGA